LRIIGGKLRGKKLAPFHGLNIRPTADRLREAIFSIIADRIRGAAVLDLYAGTGAFGLEALSRGADSALFVEHHPKAIALIRKNVTACRMQKNTRVIRWDAVRNLNCLQSFDQKFDTVFMDPPYAGDCIGPTLAHLCRCPNLANGCLIVAEHARTEPVPGSLTKMSIVDQRRYGKTLVSFLSYMI